ncbi:hypothetical protein QYM36_006398 [Artemia franciscana]|uniref:Uncharacterized protein n=1 Tax=Artemia franciscana TaxID=6661 RepID=A0AA88HTB7_ARTSF|nr:hypothetical protein QYM36_006398 [Artemia franciscana]
MTGKTQTGLDFGYDEQDKEIAARLNTHLAAIVQSRPPLNSEDFPHPSSDLMDFSAITESQVRLKLLKLKRNSITSLDLPVDLIKDFPKLLRALLTLVFSKITMSGQYRKIGKWDS